MTAIVLIQQDPMPFVLIGFGVVVLAIAAWGLLRSPQP